MPISELVLVYLFLYFEAFEGLESMNFIWTTVFLGARWLSCKALKLHVIEKTTNIWCVRKHHLHLFMLYLHLKETYQQTFPQVKNSHYEWDLTYKGTNTNFWPFKKNYFLLRKTNYGNVYGKLEYQVFIMVSRACFQ